MSTPATYVKDTITASSNPQPQAMLVASAAAEMVFSGPTAKRKHEEITRLIAERQQMQLEEEEILAKAKALRAKRNAADQLLIDTTRSQIVDSTERLKAKIVTLTNETISARKAIAYAQEEFAVFVNFNIKNIDPTLNEKYKQHFAAVAELVRSLKTKVDALKAAIAELEQLKSKILKPDSEAATSSSAAATSSSAATATSYAPKPAP